MYQKLGTSVYSAFYRYMYVNYNIRMQKLESIKKVHITQYT